jgi:hypothetical protein
MFGIDESLGILTSMITPAVLILASGSLILTTSNRLSRVIDRVRKISPEFMQLAKLSTPADKSTTMENDSRTILYRLLMKSVRRSRMLTRALTIFYLSLGIFVATSLSIGIIALTHVRFAWVATVLGMIGAVLLFIGSAILIVESRLTFSAISDEMDFVIHTAKTNAPALAEAKEKKSWRKWIDTILLKSDV